MSALMQLRQSIGNVGIDINGTSFQSTNIVYAGMYINKLSNVSIQDGHVELDITLWFKSANPHLDPENIVFNNAVSTPKITYGEKKLVDGMHYQQIQVVGSFYNNVFHRPPPFGAHFFGVTFNHRNKKQSELIYVIDQGNGIGEDYKKMMGDMKSQAIISGLKGWSLSYPHIIPNNKAAKLWETDWNFRLPTPH